MHRYSAEYKIETVEAERISVDHVARMSQEQSSGVGGLYKFNSTDAAA